MIEDRGCDHCGAFLGAYGIYVRGRVPHHFCSPACECDFEEAKEEARREEEGEEDYDD